MRTYRIHDESSKNTVKRQSYFWYGFSMILFSTVALHIYAYAVSSDSNLPLLFVPSLILTYMAFILFRYARRAIRLWNFFELELHDTYIIYRNFGVKDRKIDQQEIVNIQLKLPSEYIIVNTEDIRRQIRIPSQLHGFEDVKRHLGEWLEIEVVSDPKSHSRMVISLSVLGFITVVLTPISFNYQLAIPLIFVTSSFSLLLLIGMRIFPDEFYSGARRLSWLLLVPTITLVIKLITNSP